jgi:hypothetical protein
LFAWYDITEGLGASGGQVNVPLTLSNGTASATVNNVFIATSKIDWGFGINFGGANQQQITVQTGESFLPATSHVNQVSRTNL